MLVTSRDTESSLLTTTCQVDSEVMHGTKFRNGIYPISIVVPVFPVGIAALIIVQLCNLCSTVGLLCRIVELLLHQHGVVITIQQFITIRHPRTRELIREVDTRFATSTAFRHNLNDAIGAFRTPDSRCSSVLQHGDAGNILHID